MVPASERPSAPEIDSAVFATTIAAYQRSRRHLDALQASGSAREAPTDLDVELIHETRITRARLREVIGSIVDDAVRMDVPKTTLVRRINDHVNSLVRSQQIEPEGPILAEIIEWIVAAYPSDVIAEANRRGARPTPPHSRDVIPLHLLKQVRAS